MMRRHGHHLPADGEGNARVLPLTHAGRVALLVGTVVLAVLLGLSTGAGSFDTLAFADEPTDTSEWIPSDNLVDTQQMPDSSFIYDTEISELAGADSYYDGQYVQIVGEAVGDKILVAGDDAHRWILLESLEEASNDSVSVYLTADDASKINLFGDYHARGATLQVRGTFHLACTMHEGLSDLHADNVTVVTPGESRERMTNPAGFIPGAIALAGGIICLFVYSRMREQSR